MAVAYRDPNIPPFGPLPLLLAYNACLPPHLQFTVGNFACAMEFLAATGGGDSWNTYTLYPTTWSPIYKKECAITAMLGTSRQGYK